MQGLAMDFRIRTGGAESTVVANFGADERTVLGQFREEYQRLRDSAVLQKELPCSWSYSADEAAEPSFKAILPSEDDMAVLLHRLRPFVLQKEPASFDRVTSLLRRSMSWQELRPLFKFLRELWEGRYLANELPVFASARQLDMTELFTNWINAEEYHRDRERRLALAALHANVQPDLLNFLISSVALDKLRAVRHVAKLVRLVLGEFRKIEFEGGSIERRGA
jgi:hypothetical protein